MNPLLLGSRICRITVTIIVRLLQLSESDQDLYKNFPLVVSERWQQEVAETVFEAINQDTDKIEQKRKQKPKIEDVDAGNMNFDVQ